MIYMFDTNDGTFRTYDNDTVSVCNGMYYDDSVCIKNCVKSPKKFNFSGGFNAVDDDGNINSFYIENVIYSNPATIVMWSDGTKTVSKVHGGDTYSPEVGLVLCVLKKVHGSTKVRDLINQWGANSAESKTTVVSVSDVRKMEKMTGKINGR